MFTPALLGPADLADFAGQALEFGLLAPAAIVAWADGIIAAESMPPLWAIELSLAPDDVHEMIVRLRNVPETPTDVLPRYLFLALLRREWYRGTLTVGKVRRIGWKLHCADAIPTLTENVDWGVVLECEGEEFDEGWRSEREMRASINEKLAPYQVYEPLLPAWV
jgi:hypothetical protein